MMPLLSSTLRKTPDQILNSLAERASSLVSSRGSKGEQIDEPIAADSVEMGSKLSVAPEQRTEEDPNQRLVQNLTHPAGRVSVPDTASDEAIARELAAASKEPTPSQAKSESKSSSSSQKSEHPSRAKGHAWKKRAHKHHHHCQGHKFHKHK